MVKTGNMDALPEGETITEFYLDQGVWVSNWRRGDPPKVLPNDWNVEGSAALGCWRYQQRPAKVPEFVGDVNSSVKGSGARYNSGKPDLSQFNLKLINLCGQPKDDWLRHVLSHVGNFQDRKLEGLPEGFDYTALSEALAVIPDPLRSAAKVFSYGEKKYARYNWMKGMDWNIPIACIGRHALAILEGEDTDSESGEPHAGHIACNVIMLLHYLDYYPEGDTRPCKPD